MYVIERRNKTEIQYWHGRTWGNKSGAKKLTLEEARVKLDSLNKRDTHYQWVFRIENAG